MQFVGESPIDTYQKQATIANGLIPSRGKNTKYQPPDMSAPIKVRDFVIPVRLVKGKRIINGEEIRKAMQGDFTIQDLFALMAEEKFMYEQCYIEVDNMG